MVAVLRAIPHADWRILGRERGELGVGPKLLSTIHPFVTCVMLAALKPGVRCDELLSDRSGDAECCNSCFGN